MNNFFSHHHNKLQSFINSFKDSVLNKQRRMSFISRNHLKDILNTKNGSIFIFIILAILVGYAMGMYFSEGNLEAKYYQAKAEHTIEPFQLIKGVQDTVLIDLRGSDRFEKGHIKGAINVPAKLNEDNGTIENSHEILTEVRKAMGKKKIVLLYGENQYSLVPTQVADLLSSEGIHVKLLSIGWNEFRYFTAFWLPEQINGRVNILNYLEGSEIAHVD